MSRAMRFDHTDHLTFLTGLAIRVGEESCTGKERIAMLDHLSGLYDINLMIAWDAQRHRSFQVFMATIWFGGAPMTVRSGCRG